MRTLTNVALAAILTGFVAPYLGWIAVPVVAIIISIGSRELHLQPWNVGAGAALAWAVLLGASARNSAFSSLLNAVGSVFQMPGALLVCVALLLPFALGWSTATVATGVLGRGR